MPVRHLAVMLTVALGSPALAQGEVRSAAGLSAAAHQSWIQEATAAGFRAVAVNGFGDGGQPRFAVIAVKDGRPLPWEARHDQTAEQFAAEVNALNRKGFRPVSVSGYRGGDGSRFASLWVKDGRRLRWEERHDLTAREYADAILALPKRGLRPELVSGYADGAGSYRFVVVLVEAGRTAWAAPHDLTAEQYQEEIDKQSHRGYRPAGVTAYPTPAGPRFAAVFLKSSAAWTAKSDLSAAECQGEFERRLAQGFRPVSVAGYPTAKPADAAPFDAAVRAFMKERDIPAGTLAVSRGGRLLLARGYGFADAEGRRPVRPEDPLRIASVTKPITAAAVRELIRDGKLSLDTRVFPLLGLSPPPGRTPDPRLDSITVRHLLDHQGGWDRDQTFDPTARPLETAAALGKPGPATADDVVRFMIGQPLQFDPGSRTCYSNFGYCVLGRVIEKVSGQRYETFVRERVLAPLGISGVELARSLPGDRNPREPVYVDPRKGRNVLRPQSAEPVPLPDGTFHLEAMDAHGGLIASAVDLTRFLEAYWVTGERRQGDGRSYVHFGSFAGTFAMAMQRPNGVNVVALFNRWTDPPGPKYEALADGMRGLADRVADAELRYAVVWVKSE
jgi:CubicO group peptidase (beta-lactamase class C family)